MSKIAELDDYRVGKTMGSVAPNDKELKSDNVRYRRGFSVGRKKKNKETLQTSLSDSALRKEIKSLIQEYKRTQDSALYTQILDRWQIYTDRQIADAEDEEYVFLETEDGDYTIGKKYSKSNLQSAQDYVNENYDNMEVVGKDEEGSVYIAEKADKAKKDDEVEVIGDSLKSVKNMSTDTNSYKLMRVSDSQYAVHKDGDAAYKLIKVADHWGCTCQSYYYRGTCKHLDLLKGKVADSELAAKTYSRKDVGAVLYAVKDALGERKYEASGDYRRGLEKVPNVPIVVEDSAEGFAELKRRLESGGAQIMVADSSVVRCYVGGVPAVFVRAADGQMATVLLSTTGSAAENKRLRDCAKRKGMRLVEGGLFAADGTLIRCADEAAVYKQLGEKYKEPNER